MVPPAKRSVPNERGCAGNITTTFTQFLIFGTFTAKNRFIVEGYHARYSETWSPWDWSHFPCYSYPCSNTVIVPRVYRRKTGLSQVFRGTWDYCNRAFVRWGKVSR